MMSFGSNRLLLAGLSTSRLIYSLLRPTELFVPKGLVMAFYGTVGLLLATYLWFVIF